MLIPTYMRAFKTMSTTFRHYIQVQSMNKIQERNFVHNTGAGGPASSRGEAGERRTKLDSYEMMLQYKRLYPSMRGQLKCDIYHNIIILTG